MRTLAVVLLFAARAFASCEPPHGFSISGQHYLPACGYDSAAFALNDHGGFAAWHHSSLFFGSVTSANYGAATDASGRMDDESESFISSGLGLPQIATDGHNFLLVTYDFGTTKVAAIGPNFGLSGGSVLTSGGSSAPQGADDGNALVVWTGRSYLVLTTRIDRLPALHYSVLGATVQSDEVSGTIRLTMDNAILKALIPAGAGRALAIWKRGGVFECAMIAADGTASTPTRIDAIPPTATSISVAYDGIGFAAAFADHGRVAAVRLDGGPAIELDTNGSRPNIVWDRDAYVVVWNNGASILATRLNGSPVAIAGQGFLYAATESRDGVVLLYATGCGAIVSKVVGRSDSVLSLVRGQQQDPQVVTVATGHQVTWVENGTLLFTRFIASDGTLGNVVQLDDRGLLGPRLGSPSVFASAGFQGGSVIVWGWSDLHVARFDALGHQIGETRALPAPYITEVIKLATSADETLVITTGYDKNVHGEANAVRVDANGMALQQALLSGPDDSPYIAFGAGDESQWIVAWGDPLGHGAAIVMPHGDLRMQSRTSLTLPDVGVPPTVGDVVAGNNPAVVWTSPPFVYATFVLTQTNVLLGSVDNSVSDPRVIGGDVFCKSRNASSSRIVSMSLRGEPSAPRERACVAQNLALEFDVRDGEVDAIAYVADGLVRVQPKPHIPARRHATR